MGRNEMDGEEFRKIVPHDDNTPYAVVFCYPLPV
jgi:hypothetical protein